MINNILRDIINLCLLIDMKAKDIYNTFASNAKSKSLKLFWSGMSQDEQQHIIYWGKLLDETHNHKVPNIFDNPQKIKKELEKVNTIIEERFKRIENNVDTAAAFLMAFYLEFYLLHPAFAALFHLTLKSNGDKSPEDEYENHINRLIEGVKQFDQITPDFELFAALVQQLWNSNRELAAKIADIKTVDGLIPICTNCKKIINYEGYWEEVEYYINKR